MLNEIPWPVPAPAAARQRLRVLRRRAPRRRRLPSASGIWWAWMTSSGPPNHYRATYCTHAGTAGFPAGHSRL